jgi:hypothetical protein
VQNRGRIKNYFFILKFIDPFVFVKDQKSLDDLVKLKEKLAKSAEYGLKTSTNRPLPLRSVHVRAKLADLVAKVTIYQEYYNDETELLEAQYLFPLNDQATVCNFEAFIADKHVIGVCKEKEQAHREYREAIAQGKGAYLIDQETNELFKVNVGNLPPSCTCVIKITYITELDVQNEEIVFKLPSSISSWQVLSNNSSLLEGANEDGSAPPVTKFINKLKTGGGSSVKTTSFKASILMPFEIKSIRSPTHSLRLKNTACQAVLEVADKLKKVDFHFGKGFSANKVSVTIFSAKSVLTFFRQKLFRQYLFRLKSFEQYLFRQKSFRLGFFRQIAFRQISFVKILIITVISLENRCGIRTVFNCSTNLSLTSCSKT